MTARSSFRGHSIRLIGSRWFYADGRSVDRFPDRVCGHCGCGKTTGGHDACLRNLPGVMNACCGHGVPAEAYIQFTNGVIVKGFTEIEQAEKEKV